MRSENTYDKREKLRLLETAAEVHESKLGDPASAVEIHRDILIVDPKHRRALADLARLYEKIGDWANVATYKARIAEMSPSRKAASQQLVQLGDFLMAPDRDEIAARLQYERAVVVDPTNASAWEALQRIAAAAGDDRRVEECLLNRAKHENTPRQRAAAYVELAQLRARNGDDAGRRSAFEAAIKADPTNETAAVVMLDAYTREEKWAEAAPLCELLVNAAVRDKDPLALFVRHRLATRIFAALGDAERAMTAALAAVDDRPDDRDAQADLVAVCAQCQREPKVLARAKEQIARISADADALPPDALLRLAQVERGAGAVDAAAHTLERARERSPDNPTIRRSSTSSSTCISSKATTRTPASSRSRRHATRPTPKRSS
jgi:tetratricopeptide (TPR) repeat protein